MSDERDDADDHDIVLVHGRTEDGEGLRALRSRPQRLDAAEIRPLKEGKPLAPSAEVVRLRRREESPLLWDVEVQHDGEAESSDAGAHAGPPRVTSSAYRRNWETVFGKPGPRRAAKRLAN